MTTQRQPGVVLAPNLLGQDFSAAAPNQKWVSDFTYIETLEGWLYLAPVLDLFSRKLIGWAMSQTVDTALVEKALRMALATRQPPAGLLHHSDKGSQYTSVAYRNCQRLQHQRGRLNDGTEIGYAAGLAIGDLGGVPAITHGGATAGYRAFLGRYPEQGLSLALLCNASDADGGRIGNSIARIYLGDAAKPPSNHEPYALPIEALSKKAGLYRDVRSGVPAHLEVTGGKLQVVGWTALTPTSPLEFQAGADGPRVVFEDPSGGARPGFRIVEPGNREQRFERVDAFVPGPSQLRAFEGDSSFRFRSSS